MLKSRLNLPFLRYSRRFYWQPTQKLNLHPEKPEPFAYSQAKPQPNDDIVVAMSSGVDSSVTAALLASQYKNVRGVYMANWSQSAKCTEGEWNDVQRVCQTLDIPCERVNFEKEYWSDVFTPMIDMYQRGLTPNPDLGCNKYIKFGTMIEHLTRKFGAQKWWLATGHYARIEHDSDSGSYNLIKAYDGNKDQSYYLANIPHNVMSHLMMPLGHYTKPQVRQMAKEFRLHTASKPDSVGLCFVSPDHTKFRHFLDEYIPAKPGNIVTADGKVWGQHQGLWHATIGQKSGVSMPQGDPQYKGVWFVSEKRVDTNELVIVKGVDNEALFKTRLTATEWEWLSPSEPTFNKDNLFIQYRSLQEPARVKSLKIAEGRVEFELEQKQRAMAPGQNVVLYDGLKVLGAGVLHSTM